MATATPRIAVIGAGPAGTMVARLLHQASIQCVVFESESGPDFRSQGGTLDLHSSTGLLAISEAGLWDEFLEKSRFDSDFLQLSDPDLNILFRKTGAPPPKEGTTGSLNALVDQRPEIDRAELRRILTNSLPDGMIRWGRRLQRVEADGTLVFKNGVEEGFDLIIGADGAWSKVRALLSDVKPYHAGVVGHELEIPDAKTTAPELYAKVNRGNLFSLGPGRRISTQQMGDGSLHVSVVVSNNDETWPKSSTYDATNLEQTKKAYTEEGGMFAKWHPTLKDAILKSSPPLCRPWSLWQLPVGFRWQHKRIATLVGDSAHVMSPFAGEGVNIALEDAMKLAREIIAAVKAHPEGGEPQLDALDQAVIRYETELTPRAEKVTRLSDDLNKLYMSSPNSPDGVMKSVMSRHLKFHLSPLLYPFALAALSMYFWIVRLIKGRDPVISV